MATTKKRAAKGAAKKPIDRRKGSELQEFIDLVMTNVLNQYHFGLLQQAFEEGYKKGLEDGLKEALEASADKHTDVSVHDLKHFIRDAEEAGIQSRTDDTIGNLTAREEKFLEKEED